MDQTLTRRGFLGATAAAAAAVGVAGRATAQEAEGGVYRIQNGRLKQGVCQWSAGLPLDELCRVGAEIGLSGIDLVGAGEWGVLRDHGLICTMVGSHGIGRGFNRIENHEECIAAVRRGIDECAAAGFPNVICFSGNRDGLDDETGLANCAVGLKQIVGYAEDKGVTICMELLNSKRDHHDYMCDRSAWGVRLVDEVGSPRFRLLYDIYHMQIDEGDVIDTIRRYATTHFGHFHTAGVPGRHEIGDSQELYYPAIARAIAESGYEGYISHEFTPTGDKIQALSEAVRICDV